MSTLAVTKLPSKRVRVAKTFGTTNSNKNRINRFRTSISNTSELIIGNDKRNGIEMLPLSYIKPEPYSVTILIRSNNIEGAKNLKEQSFLNNKDMESEFYFTGQVSNKIKDELPILKPDQIIKKKLESRGVINSSFTLKGKINKTLS